MTAGRFNLAKARDWSCVLALLALPVFFVAVDSEAAAFLYGLYVLIGVPVCLAVVTRGSPKHVRAMACWGIAIYWPVGTLLVEMLTRPRYGDGTYRSWFMCFPGAPLTALGLIVALITCLQDTPADSDPEHCQTCGYCLRGLPSNRCPECGTTW